MTMIQNDWTHLNQSVRLPISKFVVG